MNAVLLSTTGSKFALFFLFFINSCYCINHDTDAEQGSSAEAAANTTLARDVADLKAVLAAADEKAAKSSAQHNTEFNDLRSELLTFFGIILTTFLGVCGLGVFQYKKIKQAMSEDYDAMKKAYEQSLELAEKQATIKIEAVNLKLQKLRGKAKKGKDEMSQFACDSRSKYEEILKVHQESGALLEEISEKAKTRDLSVAEKQDCIIAAKCIKAHSSASVFEQQMASAIALFLQKQYAPAVHLFLEILDDFQATISLKKRVRLYHYISMCYFNLGDFSVATKYIVLALREKYDFDKGWNHFGMICYNAKKYLWAKKCYNIALVHDHGQAETHNNLGKTYFKEGDKISAIKHYNKAIKANNKYTNAYINMGVAYLLIGNISKAIICYKNAIKIEPYNQNALLNLIECLVFTNRISEAATTLDKVLKRPELDGFLMSYFKTIISIIDGTNVNAADIILADFKNAVDHKISKSNWSFDEMLAWIQTEKSDFIPQEKKMPIKQFTDDVVRWKEKRNFDASTLF